MKRCSDTFETKKGVRYSEKNLDDEKGREIHNSAVSINGCDSLYGVIEFAT